MRRVHVVCKAPKQPEGTPGPIQYPTVNGILPSLPDCAVFVVDDDGTEIEIPGVSQITWTCGDNNEPATAHLTIRGVTADLVGLLGDVEPDLTEGTDAP